jgi:hypothetical protein
MVIGGIAVIAHGVQRMTTDIDAVIRGDAVKTPALLEILGKHRIVPRMRHAEAFAAKNLVLLLRHRRTGVDLDLSLGWTAFEREALAARASTRYGKVLAPMARVEELLVFKAIAGRARDIDDAVTLLTLYPHVDLKGVRRRVLELADLAETPELTRGLEQIVHATAALSVAPGKRLLVRTRHPKPKKRLARPSKVKKRLKRRTT